MRLVRSNSAARVLCGHRVDSLFLLELLPSEIADTLSRNQGIVRAQGKKHLSVNCRKRVAASWLALGFWEPESGKWVYW